MSIAEIRASGRAPGIAAAVACITIAGVSLALSVPLLAFAMEARGASGLFIGANTAMGGIAVLVATPLIPRAAAAVGVRPLLFGALVLGAASMIGFAAIEPLWLWFPLRFMLGVALGAMFVLSEFWITSLAPPRSRGLVMGLYVTALSLGFAAGPAILAAIGAHGFTPFVVGAALFGFAVVPIVLIGDQAPRIDRPERGRGVMFFIRLAPVATLAAFTFGAIETGAFTFLPLYGVRVGLDATSATLLGSAVSLGNVISQIPLGMLSDRCDRRLLLIGVAALCAFGAALMPLASASPVAFFALCVLWGSIITGLYTIGLALLGERFSGVDLATANAAFVVMYAAGMLGGPPIIGVSIDLWNPHGVPVATALMLALYAAVALIRTRPTASP
ncbi:MFS transporter [Chelatococcus sambhunathii]|uniref:MFS transporter n=1 Tax=Chelatococcus sambhunathii TaxID=363953 RepID=A0ABU1DDJ3_9HYPH|nr:MFS transporter [Chelatococcus sambhunathii]MDR4306130.1 MFS transporter [Chelatococcus sambhunathii]